MFTWERSDGGLTMRAALVLALALSTIPTLKVEVLADPPSVSDGGRQGAPKNTRPVPKYVYHLPNGKYQFAININAKQVRLADLPQDVQEDLVKRWQAL